MGSIVPRNLPPSSVRVSAVNFRLRTIVDYDAAYLRDRVVTDLFMNDTPTGIHAIAQVDGWKVSPGQAIEQHGPDLERLVIEEFMGLGYRRRVEKLEAALCELQQHVDRVRWWQLRRRWTAWRGGRRVTRPKLRRMCGGGIHRWSMLTSFRRATGAGAIIWDWAGVALVYHDPHNAWPSRRSSRRER